MSEFDAKAARAKRPLPLWVDALVRDTALLETDEFGAYVRILMAMWSSRAVALPNEPRKLARAAGVSLRLWNSRIGPALSGYWSTCDEGLTQKRLREEAAYTERQVTNQSNRKRDKKSNNPLETKEPALSTDSTTDPTTDKPTQLPNIIGDGDGSARARDSSASKAREEILAAIGVDPSGLTGPNGKIIGKMSDMQEYRRWLDLPGIDHMAVIAVIQEVMAEKRRGLDPGPPSTFTYFTKAMQRASGAMSKRPALTPITGGKTDGDHHPGGCSNRSPARAPDQRSRAVAGMADAFRQALADDPRSEDGG